MDRQRLQELHNEIQNCKVQCGVKRKPLLIMPERDDIKIIAISEAPGEHLLPRCERCQRYVIWNGRPIIEYLQEVFDNKFDPYNSVYWTHYQKCPKIGEKLTTKCAKSYLLREIEFVDPSLIIAVGLEAGSFLLKNYKIPMFEQIRIKGRNVNLGLSPTVVRTLTKEMKVAVLPHPSRKNPSWNEEIFRTKAEELAEKVRKEVEGILKYS